MIKLIPTTLLGLALAASGCASNAATAGQTKLTRAESEADRATRVEFAPDSAELTGPSKAELGQAAAALKVNPHVVQVRVEGRTDNTGSDNLNKNLSSERAQAVKSYLEEKGIPGVRIQTKAYGDTAPLASNDTDHGRAMNRSAVVIAMK